ncbi:hypothetical protein J6O86_09460 [bacterium]|nr:hypothetical protein [bacterium]
MKTDKITFGQTYIKPSLVKYMKQENIDKMPYIFGLGEFYPTDIFIGSNLKGDLTLDIMHSTPAKQLFFIDEIPKTLGNVAILNFLHNTEKAQRIHDGIKTPILKTAISDIDKLSIRDLQLAVNQKIEYYYETLAKKFLN